MSDNYAAENLISVIMPAYNAEKYIETAINSVIDQSYKEWEIIVIDDCSTDNTCKIVQGIDDVRIRYIRNSVNLGAAESRNAGIRKAQGEWIAFLDSDDCWEKDKLSIQMEYAERFNAEFVFTGSAFMDEEGNLSSSVLSVPERVGYEKLLYQNVISCSSVLIKKWLMEKYPMHGSKDVHEDFLTWLIILKENNIEAVGINEPLLVYRVRRGSKSGNKLKAAVMTFRVYRNIGLSIPVAFYYWVWYVWKSIGKYAGIGG